MNENTRRIVTRKSLKKRRESRQQILEDTVLKVVERGWLKKPVRNVTVLYFQPDDADEEFIVQVDYEDGTGFTRDYRLIIFDPVFAEALWGNQLIPNEFIGTHENKSGDWVKTYTTRPAHQVHLQQMIVATDYIRYLGEHSN